MQYVEVAVNKKLVKFKQTFTYSIPPELLPQIKLGILVLVPFKNRKIEGVITEIKSFSKIKTRLKPISKIISPIPVLDHIKLKLAGWISNYYLSTIGEVIFMMIPNVPRKNSKLSLTNSEIIQSKSQPVIYTLYDRYSNRIDQYQKLIKKVIKKGKQVILLFPEILHDIYLSNKLVKQFSKKIVLYHGNLKASERWQAWLDIANNNKQIIIGSRSTIFAPCQNLGLIIIDQPENFAYKEEQSPHYHTVKVAKEMSKLTGCLLIMGSNAANLENYYYEKHGSYKRITKSQNNLHLHNIEIINNNVDKGIITWKMQEDISIMLKQKKKTILFVNQRGQAGALICQDCGYIFKCSQCNIPLVLHQYPENLIICHHCGYHHHRILTCPKCQSVIIREVGAGIEKIASEIQKIFPKAKVQIIEKGRDKLKSANYDIIIGTQKILALKEIEANLVGIISLDFVLNLPDYKSPENTYLTIVDLINISKEKVLIQTKNPHNNFWDMIVRENFSNFLEQQLAMLKKLSYPPFSQLIKLVYKNKDLDIVKKKSHDLSLALTPFTFFGPSPCYLDKKRKKIRYQIIIKIKSKQEKDKLKTILENFAHDWKIDVDPISLL